jgi:hypothetical protein
MSTSSGEEKVGDRFNTYVRFGRRSGLRHILIDLPTPVSGCAGIPPP